MSKQKIKNNKGFVLLFAVTLTAILFAIAIGISNIALKELNFSTSAQDSNDSFFAADVGVECALYEDKSAKFPAQTTNPNLTISCNNTVPTFSTSGTTASYDFTMLALGNTNKSCVKVTVFKEWFANTSIVNTLVTSRGYNLGGDGSCGSTSSRLVERELDVRYGTHRNLALGRCAIAGACTGVSQSGNPLSNLTDGNYISQVYPGAPDGRTWSYEVDLGSSVLVSQIRVVLCKPTHIPGNNGCYGYDYWGNNGILGDGDDSPYINHWKIEGYNGSYSTLAESTASPNGVPNSHKIEISLPANTNLQKIKVSAESTVNWIGLYELEAY